MNKPRLVQQGQSVEELLRKDSDESGAETTELVLLDELVKVDAEELEHEAEVLPVYEGILQSEEVMIVILVEFTVELSKGKYTGFEKRS